MVSPAMTILFVLALAHSGFTTQLEDWLEEQKEQLEKIELWQEQQLEELEASIKWQKEHQLWLVEMMNKTQELAVELEEVLIFQAGVASGVHDCSLNGTSSEEYCWMHHVLQSLDGMGDRKGLQETSDTCSDIQFITCGIKLAQKLVTCGTAIPSTAVNMLSFLGCLQSATSFLERCDQCLVEICETSCSLVGCDEGLCDIVSDNVEKLNNVNVVADAVGAVGALV